MTVPTGNRKVLIDMLGKLLTKHEVYARDGLPEGSSVIVSNDMIIPAFATVETHRIAIPRFILTVSHSPLKVAVDWIYQPEFEFITEYVSNRGYQSGKYNNKPDMLRANASHRQFTKHIAPIAVMVDRR